MVGHENCLKLKFPFSGKRRYDRKQRGYGGQTKPIFRKKVGKLIDFILNRLFSGLNDEWL